MFATANIHDLLNRHYKVEKRDGVITDIQQSDTWKNEWFGDDGEFGNQENGVVLNICLDGVNPFTSQKIGYSLWPIELSILNFPPRFPPIFISLL